MNYPPPKNISNFDKQQALEDERFRNAIEGKFGQAKRRFSLNLVMTKLPETSITSIVITFLAVNLSTLLRQLFSLFLSLSLNSKTNELNKRYNISFDYIFQQYSVVKLINFLEKIWSKTA